MIELQRMTIKDIKKDKDNIINYLSELFKQDNIYDNLTQVERIYDNMFTFILDGTAIIIGAYENKQLLGFIWAYERAVNDEKRYHINYFFVNKEYRKQGIGSKLINFIYDIAKENDIKKIELIVTAENKKAFKFYQMQDFQKESITLCKKIFKT